MRSAKSMSTANLHDRAVSRDLHASVLPMLAFVAAFDDSALADRARAHLDALIGDTEHARACVDRIAGTLRDERGTLLEPFYCPAELSRWLATATYLLAPAHPVLDAHRVSAGEPGDGTEHDKRSPLIVMNHGIRSAWCGVSVTRSGARRVSAADIRAHIQWQNEHTPEHDQRPHPMVVGLELMRTADADICVCPATFEVQGLEPTLTMPCEGPLSHLAKLIESNRPYGIPLPAPTLHFAHGYAGGSDEADGPTPGDRAHGGSHGQIPAIAGEVLPVQAASRKYALRFRLHPTTLLRLAALPGAKRFVARVTLPVDEDTDPEDICPVPAQIIAGSLDTTGVRAVLIPWTGWTIPAADLMPAVPFRTSDDASHPDGTGGAPCPGSFDSLVDLLLDLLVDPLVDPLVDLGTAPSKPMRTSTGTPVSNARKPKSRARAACASSVLAHALTQAMSKARSALRS